MILNMRFFQHEKLFQSLLGISDLPIFSFTGNPIIFFLTTSLSVHQILKKITKNCETKNTFPKKTTFFDEKKYTYQNRFFRKFQISYKKNYFILQQNEILQNLSVHFQMKIIFIKFQTNNKTFIFNINHITTFYQTIPSQN